MSIDNVIQYCFGVAVFCFVIGPKIRVTLVTNQMQNGNQS